MVQHLLATDNPRYCPLPFGVDVRVDTKRIEGLGIKGYVMRIHFYIYLFQFYILFIYFYLASYQSVFI